MITTLLFDLDDTLFDFQTSERVALVDTLRQSGIDPTADVLRRFHEINRQQWDLLEQGKLTRDEVLVRRFSLLFDEYGITQNADVVRRLYERCMCECRELVPNAVEIVQRLSLSHSLYLITNGTAHIQRQRLSKSPISPYFQGVFISQDIGYNKPDSRYFEECFSRIPDFQKEKTVIIGDSLTSDILGGNRVGVTTCWFNPFRRPLNPPAKPDFEIRSLNELPDLIDSL